jgi:hypothetical protein
MDVIPDLDILTLPCALSLDLTSGPCNLSRQPSGVNPSDHTLPRCLTLIAHLTQAVNTNGYAGEAEFLIHLIFLYLDHVYLDSVPYHS